MPDLDLTHIKLTLVLEENKPPKVEVESGGLTGTFPFPLTGDSFVVRPSSSISIALAMKGVYTDTNADGLPDCDRRGQPTEGGGEGGGGGAPEWVPTSALAFADFVNGHYYAGGAETTLGAMFAADSNWGSWSGTLGENGLVGFPVLAGGLVNADSFTTVVRFTLNGTEDQVMVDAFDPDYTVERAILVMADTTTGPTPYLRSASNSNGSHVAAASMSDTIYAASVDGAAVITNDIPAGTPTVIGITGGAANGSGASIQSITFYPIIAAADLPALSAL